MCLQWELRQATMQKEQQRKKTMHNEKQYYWLNNLCQLRCRGRLVLPTLHVRERRMQ